jgi:hypothetical protein
MIYPLYRLKEQDVEVTGFFYNPNIHPLEEYERRRQAVEEYSKAEGIEVIYPEYNPEEFFKLGEFKEGDTGRCPVCWEWRLRKAAVYARDNQFDCFSTTLLVSPYQDHGLLRGIGEHLEEEENTVFFYEDFRPGFRKAHDEARKHGLYCQKYCGCIHSERERCRKSEKR